MAVTGINGRIINLGLRGITLGCKFFLIFFLAKLLSPDQVGLYGLLVATIGYTLFLLGFDFYTYTTRELRRTNKTEWGLLLKGQIALSLLAYAVFIPLSCLLFVFDVLPLSLLGWFVSLLVLEHIAQEINRLLIAISRPLLASWVMFLRSGVWVFPVVLLLTVFPEYRNLESILLAWSLGNLLAICMGSIGLWHMQTGGWRLSVNWHWVRRGLLIAAPLLVATLALRGIYTLDRYWFELHTEIETLAAYVLFMGLTHALLTFLDAGIFAFTYPTLISLWHKQMPAEFRLQLRTMTHQTVLICLMFGAISVLILPALLEWIDRFTYSSNSYLFNWLLAAAVLSALSMTPHYALYAQGKDRCIIVAHLSALLTFVATALLLRPAAPALAVPAALCGSMGVMLVLKIYLYYRYTPAEYQIFRRVTHSAQEP